MSYQPKADLFCHHPVDLNDRTMQQKFDQWISASKQTQIRAVSALTGLLYLVAYIADTLVAPPELLPMMTVFHFYVLPLFLFVITLMTFKKELMHLTTFLLILAPIVAAIGTLVIIAGIERPAMRLTEVYLILFWIFTVSGLRLRYATISALIIFIMVFVVSYFYLPLTLEYFVMHCFWMSAAFSFGFLGAFLIETSNKKIFINHEQLKKAAVTDKLTGLYNRAHFDDLLQEELNRSQRYGDIFGLVLIDFDYFKRINDTYGHQVGDAALIEIAELMLKNLRSSDKIIRWGGEEFIIIYLNTDREEVLKRAEELRHTIASHHFETVGNETASMGITLYKNADTVDSIIKRTDNALYRAKEKGRNRVEFL